MMFFRNFFKNIPRLPLLVALILIAIDTLTRIVLLVSTGMELVPMALWPRIFVQGLWFDLAVVTVLLAPLMLYEALLPNSWRTSRWHGVLRLIWLWSAVSLLLFGAVSEMTFWLEFSTRFNFIAVDYLIYTQEVIGNIRESYPVGLIVSGIAAVAGITVLLLKSAVQRVDSVPVRRSQRAGLALAALLLPVLFLRLANVDQMTVADNAYATELSGNGLFSLAAAMRRNELDYDRFYRTIPGELAYATLQKLDVKRAPLMSAATLQTIALPQQKTLTGASPLSRRPRNLVLISVESLSASFVGAYGATNGITPNLDALAREGMKFEQVFATGTRTVRGLEALSLGTPPVPGQAIVRRPGNEHLSTIGQLLHDQGVSSYYFYGGYGYFDNMNAYFSANDYKVVDRTDFPKASVQFENIWGVADEFMFDNVLTTFDAKATTDKPFFAHIMTTTNHRPYTYPDGRIDIASPGGRDGGVKYTDYAIGKFIRDAKSKPWFKDTLFVIVADHCASVAGKSKLPVKNYHIPLIFYAPGMLAPSTYKPIVSQIDLAPTLLDILGKSGAEQFFGRSFFAEGPPQERAFISNYQELGYMKNGLLTVLLPKQKVESYRVDPATWVTTPAEVDPALLQEAIAYYQTASAAFKSGALRAPQHQAR
jgi:phosphoglycerol transferase MdoB-like AlkP superfamily enzyme